MPRVMAPDGSQTPWFMTEGEAIYRALSRGVTDELAVNATLTTEEPDDMKWWNPNSVVREVNRRKQAGVCPMCQHGPHRDGPCDLCGERCRYPKSYDAAFDRFTDARADFGKTVRTELERLFRRGR